MATSTGEPAQPSNWIGLEDAEAMHREAPRTFSIPRRAQRRGLRVGDLVKLIFLADPPSPTGMTAERMWVEVVEARGSGFVGVLGNAPSFISGLAQGDQIEFGPEHVCALSVAPSGLSVPYGQWAVVSRGISERNAWPDEVIRVALPDEGWEGWSGWFVYSEGEDGPFRGNSENPLPNNENFVPMLVDDLVQRFRILDSVLDETIGTSWRWNTVSLEYEPMDWPIDESFQNPPGA